MNVQERKEVDLHAPKRLPSSREARPKGMMESIIFVIALRILSFVSLATYLQWFFKRLVFSAVVFASFYKCRISRYSVCTRLWKNCLMFQLSECTVYIRETDLYVHGILCILYTVADMRERCNRFSRFITLGDRASPFPTSVCGWCWSGSRILALTGWTRWRDRLNPSRRIDRSKTKTSSSFNRLTVLHGIKNGMYLFHCDQLALGFLSMVI